MAFGIRKIHLGLQARISLVVLVIVLVSLGIETFFIKGHIENYIVAEEGKRVLNIATATAQDPDIIAAFKLQDPSSVIQPIAEKIRLATGTTFVVVFNMETVRYSHPLSDRLGKHFVGGDEQEALAGKRYVSQALGTLGLSLRAFAPVYQPEEKQIGVVSVGKLLVQIEEETRRLSIILYYAAGASLLIGLGGALILSRSIKRTLFGLEPREIAALLEERNIIISSIKEGIVAVDLRGEVILINENAKRLLGLAGGAEDARAAEAVAGLKLSGVVASGKADYDEEEILGDKVVLINRIPMISKGKIIGAVSTFRDMSEVRTLAEELTAVKQYVNGLRSQHHEFLNKLHVIAGLLQLERYGEAVKFTVSAVRNNQRLFDLLRRNVHTPAVSGLLIAKINEGREHEIDLSLGEDGTFPLVREDCVNPLVTILGNLLQNSLESLKGSSGEDKKIVLTFAETEKELVLDVKDNGRGIPPELRDKVFEEGFTSKADGGNMGLGLFLVRRHLDRLGGSIELRHENGTEALVRIPKENVLP